MKMYKNKILKKTTTVSQYWSQLYDGDFLINYPSQNNSIYTFHTLHYHKIMYLFIYLAISASMAISTFI